MTSPDYLAGEDINVDPWLVMGAPVQTWVPVLTANTTNPTMGTGAIREGWYVQADRILAFWGRIRFGTAGVNPGVGDYRVALPTEAANISGIASATLGNGIVLGRGCVRDQTVVLGNSRHATMQLISRSVNIAPLGNVATAAWVLFDGAIAQAGAAAPFTFAAEDTLIFQGIYPVD